MALAIGNLLGAVANITTAVAHEKSYKSFLNNISDLGVQTTNLFEVNFSGLDTVTFRVQNVTLPAMRMNTTEIFYDGKSIEVPINYDYEHDFSMSILNDASGYYYSAIQNLIMSDGINGMVNGGYTMTIKALADSRFPGAMITCTGVRITSIDGLSFDHSANDVQMFGITGQMQNFTVTPGAVGTFANINGALNNIFG